jgi:hypothetical protein
MRSIHLTCRGSTGRIGHLFVAAGLSVGVFYLFAAILAWQLGHLPTETLALTRLGVRPLLCCYHGCQLDIPLYPPYRFFARDYSVFDFGCMAFIEVGFPTRRSATCGGVHHYWPMRSFDKE